MILLNSPALADPRGPWRQLEAVDAALCRLRSCIRERDDFIERRQLVRLARAVLIWRRTLEALYRAAAKP